MSIKRRDGIRVAAALLFPIALSIAVMSWLGARAQAALDGRRCGLDLPWARATSEFWLELFLGAALRQAQSLRRLSSDCVAGLHIDLSIVFLINIISTSVLCAILLYLAGIMRGSIFDFSKMKRENFILITGFGFVLLTLFVWGPLNYSPIINFNPNITFGNLSTTFDGVYVDINSFVNILQAHQAVMVAAVFSLLSCISAYRLSRNNNK